MVTPTEAEIINYAERLLMEHRLYAWKIVLDERPRKRAGQCRYKSKEIGISRSLIRVRSVAETKETVLHEVAHALNPGDRHGEKWRATFIELGGDGNRCFDADELDFEAAGFRYRGECPNGHRFYYTRRVKKRRSCAACNPFRFDPRNEVSITDLVSGKLLVLA